LIDGIRESPVSFSSESMPLLVSRREVEKARLTLQAHKLDIDYFCIVEATICDVGHRSSLTNDIHRLIRLLFPCLAELVI
jgi:hypothetical protein